MMWLPIFRIKPVNTSQAGERGANLKLPTVRKSKNNNQAGDWASAAGGDNEIIIRLEDEMSNV